MKKSHIYAMGCLLLFLGCGGDEGGTDITANINCSVVIMDEKQLSNALETGEAGIEDIQPIPGSNSYQVTMCNNLFTNSEMEQLEDSND